MNKVPIEILSKVFTHSGGRGAQCESVLWHVTCGPLYMQTTVYTHSYFSQDVIQGDNRVRRRCFLTAAIIALCIPFLPRIFFGTATKVFL